MIVTICAVKNKEAEYFVDTAIKMGYEVFDSDGLYKTTVLTDGLSWQHPDNRYLKFDTEIVEFVFKEQK